MSLSRAQAAYDTWVAEDALADQFRNIRPRRAVSLGAQGWDDPGTEGINEGGIGCGYDDPTTDSVNEGNAERPSNNQSRSTIMNIQKPADFRYESHYADVLGSRMHDVEHGTGDPILFLHGQPTWSYLWRNVMPELEDKGRLIAVDRIENPCIGGEPAEIHEKQTAYMEWLGQTSLPKLLLHAEPGVLLAQYRDRQCGRRLALHPVG